MHYSTLLVAAAGLLGTTMAAPVELDARQVERYTWDVTRWKTSCTGVGCHYKFTVSAEPEGTIPGFKAVCSGFDDGAYVLCDLKEQESQNGVPTVFGKLKPVVNPNGGASFRMAVQMTYTDEVTNPGTPATYTYNAHTKATGKSFYVVPKKKMSIA